MTTQGIEKELIQLEAADTSAWTRRDGRWFCGSGRAASDTISREKFGSLVSQAESLPPVRTAG